MIKIENFEVVGWEHAIRGMRNPKNSWNRSDSTFKETATTTELDENGNPQEMYVRFDALNLGPNDKSLAMTLRNAGTDHRKLMRYLAVYVDITAPLYWWKEFKTYRHGRKFMDDGEQFTYDDDVLEYHIETNSCSTMHKIHDKEFTLEDFSHEHLLSMYSGYDDWKLPSIDLSPNLDGSHIFSPHGVLNIIIIPMLNDCRTKFLETGDKTYWWQMIQLLPSSYNQKRTVMLNYEVLANMYKSRRNHKLDEWREFCKWIEDLPYSDLITGTFTCTVDETSKVEAAYKALVAARDSENIDADAFGEAITDAIGYLGEVLE
jgi:hypothetical protein